MGINHDGTGIEEAEIREWVCSGKKNAEGDTPMEAALERIATTLEKQTSLMEELVLGLKRNGTI